MKLIIKFLSESGFTSQTLFRGKNKENSNLIYLPKIFFFQSQANYFQTKKRKLTCVSMLKSRQVKKAPQILKDDSTSKLK